MNGISYTLFDPTGNMTVLAAMPDGPAECSRAAGRLFAAESTAEQVGFFSEEEEGPCLRMAGGEFCGNAAMCAAFLFLSRRGRDNGSVSVRFPDVGGTVGVSVSGRDDGTACCTVEMPKPLSVGRESLDGGLALPVVRFPGITHVILEAGKDDVRDLPAKVAGWCSGPDARAFGVMVYDRRADTLSPLVFVPGAGTLIWETACASGTSALGAWLAAKSGRKVTISPLQPGGRLTVSASPDGEISLTGTVRAVRSGVLE